MGKNILSGFVLGVMLFCFVSTSAGSYIVTQLTNNNTSDKNPDINNKGEIVWSGYDGEDYEIFLYDGTSIKQLTDNNYDDMFPSINDFGAVVWGGNQGVTTTGLYLYESMTQLTTLISNNAYRAFPADINNNGDIVWAGHDGFDSELFLYTGADKPIAQITDNISDDLFPTINDSGQIAWNQDFEIYLYNGSIKRLTDNSHTDYSPHINDLGNIIWGGAPGGEDREIYLYDGGDDSISQVTDNVFGDITPDINNNGDIVWAVFDSNEPDIYYLGSGSDTAVKITDNEYAETYPKINDKGTIVWNGKFGAESEIFIATPAVPEPATIILFGIGLLCFARVSRKKQ